MEDFTFLDAEVFLRSHVKMELKSIPMKLHLKREEYKAAWEQNPDRAPRFQPLV